MSNVWNQEKQTEGLKRLRAAWRASSDSFCFVERHCILLQCQEQFKKTPEVFGTTFLIHELCEKLSTPMYGEDVFLGRMVEGPMLLRNECVCGLGANGHSHVDFPMLLKLGMKGIIKKAKENAEKIGTEDARNFAENVRIMGESIHDFALRYAKNARMAAGQYEEGLQKNNLLRAAFALERVPWEPAFDFFSALQSIHFIHFVLSCVVGARDFGYGFLDRELLSFYRKDIKDGTLIPEQAKIYVEHLILGANVIAGVSSDQPPYKPVPSEASNQYILLGGRYKDESQVFNELTQVILDAAVEINLPQPSLIYYWDEEMTESSKLQVSKALSKAHGQLQIYHLTSIVKRLASHGFPKEVCYEAGHNACCMLTLPGRMGPYAYEAREVVLPAILNALIIGKEDSAWQDPMMTFTYRDPEENYKTFEEFFDAFLQAAVCYASAALQRELDLSKIQDRYKYALPGFNAESMFVGPCIEYCEDWGARDGKRPAYKRVNQNIIGVATTVDSLIAIRRLVYEDKKMTFAHLAQLLRSSTPGENALRGELPGDLERFGQNKEEGNALARKITDTMFDTFDKFFPKFPQPALPCNSVYSLWNHITYGKRCLATADGRACGAPLNENQSPSPKAASCGIPAALQSMPYQSLDRTLEGGTNLVLPSTCGPEVLKDLIDGYFSIGGLHLGITKVARETLEDAMENPQDYPDLVVRMYGYSALFAQLPRQQQLDVISRT